MIIISQSNVYVNTSDVNKSDVSDVSDKKQTRKSIDKMSDAQKWQYHKSESIRIAAKLLAAGYRERSKRMYMCSREIVAKRCADCGHIMIEHVKRCKDRLCPVCNWRLSIARYAKMSQIMTALYNAYPDTAYSLITLTVRNCKPSDLKHQITDMQHIWALITQQRWFRHGVIGWGRSLEITYNASARTLHPHYHILLMGYDNMPNKIISDWIRLCADRGYTASTKAQHVDNIVTHHTEGATLAASICETYKYMVKTSDIDDMPVSVLRYFADAVKGVRLVAFGGKVKEYANNLDIDMDDDSDDDDIKLCTHCKSSQLDELILCWSFAKLRYVAAVPSDTLAAIDINDDIEDIPDVLSSIRRLQTLAQDDIYADGQGAERSSGGGDIPR